ncbi:MAG: bifunctional phosphoribosyl-AMP cyclohydrolase/phosphoribosyl-ATP diphosphatase HisIE [Lachnospiraceae bacterium]|nr:bifunctional phosphoribosyl-AMP cyclohydrolase/phosphoribosyl-ATP diphosphatase HisIE [Lachnospiraceae bacterium]
MNNKRLIPCIYLFNKIAIRSYDDTRVLSTDPVALAKECESKGADALYVMDLSHNDAEHDAAIDMLKSICDAVSIPVYGAGNVNRAEDIKKILYAGCTKATLNYSKASNIELTEEVSKRFGADKLVASIANLVEVNEHKKLLEEYVSEILFMTYTSSEDACKATKLPVIAVIPDDDALDNNGMPEAELKKLVKLCKIDNFSGISGDVIGHDLDNIQLIKNRLKEKGLYSDIPAAADGKITWANLKKISDSDGLVPVIVQDYKNDEVLMMAYMNEEAFNKTLETGNMTYYSRSRGKLWLKGEESGHFQYLKSMYVDCDSDTLLAKVEQVGAACHTGNRTCFYTNIFEKETARGGNPLLVFNQVMDVILDRKKNPKEGSYTNYLFDKGLDKILKKVGEETTEIVIAAKNPNPNEVVYEISDLLYHLMVLMAERGISWEEITEELAKR